MYTQIKKYVEAYERLKDTVIGNLELEAYRYELEDFFAPSYVGHKNYVQVMKYLNAQIVYRKQQKIDLRYSSGSMRFRWKRLERKENGYSVWLSIDWRIRYRGVEVETILTKQERQIELTEVGGKLKIERDRIWEQQQVPSEVLELPKGRKRKFTKPLEMRLKQTKKHYKQTREKDIMPRGIYDRQKAVEYAKKYALQPNTEQWKNYEKYGGDCTNFVSQCLYAGGIPFDHSGKYITDQWYWYSDTHRTPSFTSANALKIYMTNNEGFGLVSEQVESKEELDIGDIVQLGDEQQTTHSMIVVGRVYDKENPTQINDLLIAQHSTEKMGRGYNIPLSTKPDKQLYFKVLGYNP